MRTRKSLAARGVRVLLAGAVLFGAAPAATHAQSVTNVVTTTTSLIPLGLQGAWKMQFKPDTVAEKAGRLPFEDYMYIDDSSISSQEIARLGMDTTGGSATELVGTITFNHTMSSRHHGSTVSNGTAILGKMNGTLKWTIDGVTYNYTYTGEKYTPSNAES